MKPLMLDIRKDLKVLNAIVLPVAIKMVDLFITPQFTSEMCFHHHPMC